MSRPRLWSSSDRRAIVQDALRVAPDPLRRRLLRGGLTVGGLALLSGCALDSQEGVEQALMRISRWNDRVQAALFDPTRLAPTYRVDEVTRPFPFNAYYDEDHILQPDVESWRLELGGLVSDRRPWRLSQLRALTQVEQVTRHICVEGWSAIGRWSGVPFGDFLRRVGADLTAPYVAFHCADDYRTSIDMASALHPQTLLALDWDGAALPARYGQPVKLRLPVKLGYKNPKHIVALEVTRRYPGGYWEDQGYNWFGGS